MPPSFPEPFRCAARRGSVLVVVLVVCIGLVSVTLVFGNAMMLAYRGEDNDLAARQAQTAIDGAARYAQTLLTPSAASIAGTGTGTSTSASATTSLSGSTLNFGDVPDPLLYRSDAVPLGSATFWFIGRPQASDPMDQPVFSLVDEASKFNINRFTRQTLLLLPGMTEELADAIFAWRSLPGASGNTAQLVLDNSPKSAPFESEAELAQVNGGTDLSLLYGTDTNANHAFDAGETGLASGTSQASFGLMEYITVFSRESNTLPNGTKRVRVNDRPAFLQLMNDTLGSTRGGQLAAKFPPPRPGQPAQIFNSQLELYAFLSPEMTADEFDKLSPKLTSNNNATAAFTNGLVNVNTAGPTVLGCVPGLNADAAAQIVAARQSRTQPSTGLAWVLPVLRQASALAAGRYLTGQSYQFSADVAAVGRHGRGYRRTRFVIDTSTGTARIVYRRDLTGLGWALGSRVRQNLAGIVDAPGRTEGGGLPR